MANFNVVMRHVERLKLLPDFPDVKPHVLVFLAEQLIKHCPEREFEGKVWTTEMQTDLATSIYVSAPGWRGPGYMWNQFGLLWEFFERAEYDRLDAERSQRAKEEEESRRKRSQEDYEKLLRGEGQKSNR